MRKIAAIVLTAAVSVGAYHGGAALIRETVSVTRTPSSKAQMLTALDHHAGELNAAERREFATQFKQGCMVKQQGDPLNRELGITEEVIDRYCGCTARRAATMTTIEELRALVAVDFDPTAKSTVRWLARIGADQCFDEAWGKRS